MHIRDDFELNDLVTGLRLTVVPGKAMDRLHIEIHDAIRARLGVVSNRDFFFTKDGEFDGTGDRCSQCGRTWLCEGGD